MGFRCGIVGLPNVGKSTLFNALTSSATAQTANYPFCTITPNIGIIGVPDERLLKLASIGCSAKIVLTQIEFVDIAGLVRGASRGEGLGNRFLAHIRTCDAIAHVLRCFKDEDIIHVNGSVNPLRDADIVETELMLADLDNLEHRALTLSKKTRVGDKDSKIQMGVVELLLDALRSGKPVRSVHFDSLEKRKQQQQLFLLTAKPMLYVCNVNESAIDSTYIDQLSVRAATVNAVMVVIAGAFEAELMVQLSSTAERKAFSVDLGIAEAGLSTLIKASYQLLDLITFFTIGPKEARAWTARHGTKASEAAGVIHSDFERGFIRAEVIAYDDFLTYKGEQGAREAGRMRAEGRNYPIADGDIVHFLFNV